MTHPSVTAATKKLAVLGGVALVVTAILGIWAILKLMTKLKKQLIK